MVKEIKTQNKNEKIVKSISYGASAIPYTNYALEVKENEHIDGHVTYSAILAHNDKIITERFFALLSDAYSTTHKWDLKYSTM
jgi:hypothetical protein|tara:strand:+ start:439 stop:687 length:249 start_codon:yes stop_codon:yes gene_type:complete